MFCEEMSRAEIAPELASSFQTTPTLTTGLSASAHEKTVLSCIFSAGSNAVKDNVLPVFFSLTASGITAILALRSDRAGSGMHALLVDP